MDNRRVRALVCLAVIALVWRTGAGAAAAEVGSPKNAASELFATPLLDLELRLKGSAWEALSLQTMESPKLYAEASVQTKSGTWRAVGIKLKGSYGSFQSADERPGLTLHFDKFKGARSFYGLTRLHLNNGAQDDSRLNEWLGGELARAAGVPAGRATHAWLTLQGKDRGLYVVRESFTPDFLSQWFGAPGKGDLYDAAAGGDLRLDMEKDQGEEGDHAALQELITACENPDAEARGGALAALADLPSWRASFVAEVLLGHWDGYSLAANNYRLYRRPSDGRLVFLLHGMDQVLGDPDAPVYASFQGMAARALEGMPGGMEAYAAEVRRQALIVWASTDWAARIRSRTVALAEAVSHHDAALPSELIRLGRELEERFLSRCVRVKQAALHPPQRVTLGRGGRVSLSDGWYAGEENGGEFLPPDAASPRRDWQLRAKEGTEASWRQTVWLDPGRYRFTAVIRTTGVVSEPGTPLRGAGLRVLGSDLHSRSWIRGTRGPRSRHVDFEADGPVTLLLELRAEDGVASFNADSLVLERR